MIASLSYSDVRSFGRSGDGVRLVVAKGFAADCLGQVAANIPVGTEEVVQEQVVDGSPGASETVAVRLHLALGEVMYRGVQDLMQ